MNLKLSTSQQWVDAVLSDFNAFLLDHAASERKASAAALTFLVRYPDKTAIIEPLIQLAREELAHFHRVYKFMESRNLIFQRDMKDPYLAGLRKAVKSPPSEEFLDRLLLAGVVEARGCERFTLVGEAINDPALKVFYIDLAHSEGRHADLFESLAAQYHDKDRVNSRLEELLTIEAKVVSDLPIRAALH